MNIPLLKQLGHMNQLAGIREYQVLRGKGGQTHMAEFHNAAGLRFTVVPDRCMDLYDFSYKGVNFSFQAKNGLAAPQYFSTVNGDFAEEWTAGMLCTCGLANVGGPCETDGIYPTHGRIGHASAQSFGTDCHWEGEDYILRVQGEMNQSKLCGRHLTVRRTIETGLNRKSLILRDVITNHEPQDEPYMLLYHINFGYPIVQPDSKVAVSPCETEQLNGTDPDFRSLTDPIDGAGEDLFLHRFSGERAGAVIWNERLQLGAYVCYDTRHLPNMVHWKLMRSHDYVVGLEPANTCGLNRADAIAQNKIAVLPAYSSVETGFELGVLDGMDEIQQFLHHL